MCCVSTKTERLVSFSVTKWNYKTRVTFSFVVAFVVLCSGSIYFLADPPEVETERGTVHTGIGLEAQLVCIVHAEPAPQVRLLFIFFVNIL